MHADFGGDLPARVLIVDDEPHNRQLLKVMLAPEGYLMLTAASGDEALAMVALQPPDLILLDIMMPGLDGYQLTTTLKADPAVRHVPIILVTALDDREARLRGMRAGAEDFLTKPVDRAELCVRVRNLLHLKAYGQYVQRLADVERLKTEFLSTVSHELRTPLTSIRGSLGLLASGAVGPLSVEGTEVVAVAERNAVRLMALINDILDLDRLETGTLVLQFAEVSVQSILRRAMDSLASLGHHGVTVDVPEVDSTIWADADRIVQVVVNLLANAVKFSPPGETVTVAVEGRARVVEFRITDRGRGVPAAYRKTIFERFRQVETSDAREKGGTGLGLAICRAIIEQHGGTIGVDAATGGGSTFWFRLPPAAVAVPMAVGAGTGRKPQP